MKQKNMNRTGARDVIEFFSRWSRATLNGVDIVSAQRKMVTWLNDLSAQEASAQNAQAKELYRDWLAKWQAKNSTTAMPRRNPFQIRKAIDYSRIDFREVCGCADKLFAVYLDNGGMWGAIVRDRYIVSVARALEILNSPEAHKYGCVQLVSGFNWAYDPLKRNSLWSRLQMEKKGFVEQGWWPDGDDIETLKRKLSERPSFTISDCVGGDGRALVMLAVLARLMVGCAKNESAIWAHDELFKVYVHILCATMRVYELAFPWHLDITTDYLRLGRTHARQTCMVMDYINGRFYDASERMVFGGFVTHYLQERVDRAAVWKSIVGNERMAKFFDSVQLSEIGCMVEQTAVVTNTKSKSKER